MLYAHSSQHGKNGIGYPPFKDTCKPKPAPKGPKPKWCTGCMKDGHFEFECVEPNKKATPNHLKAFAHGAHYVLRRMSNGKVMAKFMGPRDNMRPNKIWVPKTIMPPPLPNPNASGVPLPRLHLFTSGCPNLTLDLVACR